jgi:hypothetical protein
LKKLFGKIASPTGSCIDEREIRERGRINYFFQLHLNSYLCERRRKIASYPRSCFGNECLAKKKTHEAIVNYVKQALSPTMGVWSYISNL